MTEQKKKLDNLNEELESLMKLMKKGLGNKKIQQKIAERIAEKIEKTTRMSPMRNTRRSSRRRRRPRMRVSSTWSLTVASCRIMRV